MKKSIGPRTLAYPTPVFVVGTYDADDKPNVMTAAWCGICCSVPPCVTISLRKATYTYGNLMEKRAYTISIPGEKYVKEADYFGVESGRKADKLAVTGLTPVKSDKVDAPYVKEFPVVLECKVIHTYEIGLHTQFIGEIIDIKVAEDYLNDKGLPDVKKVKPMIFAPENLEYYGFGDYLGKAFSIGKELRKK